MPSFGRLDIPIPQTTKAPGPEVPFRIAVLGDFSGRANRGESVDLAGRKALPVTREVLDELLEKLQTRLRLPTSKDEVEVTFAALDHFHPDELHARVSQFEDCFDDDEKTELLSAVLHHPDFQGLESAWRGLDWLLRRLQKKESRVEVVLYDISQAELAADLNAVEDLATTGLYQQLIEQATTGSQGKPWALWVGLYTFELSAEQAELLGRLAKIAAHASAPFLAAGPSSAALDPEFAPTAEATAAWDALRDLPEASWLGLAVPRFLMRLPYGENTKSIDPFPYEEFTGPQSKSVYLWANPALAPACLLGMAFLKQGWALKAGEMLDLEAMTMHVYTQDEEQEVTVAEAWLARPVVERLVKLGLMPLLSVRGKDALQLFRILSLARPPKGQQASDLSGRWGGKGAVKPVHAGGPPGVSVGFGLGGAPVPAPAREPTAAPEAGEADEERSEASQEAPQTPVNPEEAPAAEEEMDPELAALMKQMEDGAAAAPPPVEEEMDPELAALMKQLEESEPAPEATAEPPAEEEMDPELAALMRELEAGSAAEPAAAPEPEPPTEEMDPELAALMRDLEAASPEEPVASAAPEPAAPAPESAEEMDPELAALMRDLEAASPEEPAPTPAEPAAETDPELAALMRDLEQAGTPEAEPEPAAEATAAEEMDPELAALMRDLEQADTTETEPSPAAPAAEPEPTAVPGAAEEMDPELAALMEQLEQTAPAEPEPVPAEEMDPELAALMEQVEGESTPQPETLADPLQEQIDSLGGMAALEDLGWPVFARSFRADRQRQLRLLQGQIRNRTAEREVRRLVRICGGYGALESEGITPEMGLNAQLTRLRALRATHERVTALTNEELLLMAAAYGARLKSQKSDEAKAGLLLMVQDYDRWASDPRFEDVVVTVQRAPFEERRQTQLQHQFSYLGGEAVYQEMLGRYPQDADAEAPLEQKIALLRALREYNWLGGDAAYAEHVGEDGSEALGARLEKLRAVVRAQE